MHIREIQIKNFRALEDIEVKFDNRVNVIVGPNAIGKTTILEAIRLVKATTSPRTQNESIQALFALGASSPHAPQSINLNALLRDANTQATIRTTYWISDAEQVWLSSNAEGLARNILQARLGQAFANPAAMLQYLGSSDGLANLARTHTEITAAIAEIKRDKGLVSVKLRISPTKGLEVAEGSLAGGIIAAIDQRNPTSTTSFSYFPADRALPQGEQQVQIGGADAQQQLESHNSQPQLKYSRLKNTIFNSLFIQDASGKSQVTEDFKTIFEGILRGKRLKGFGISNVGLLSIQIEDIETQRLFDIDAMSSGEKGLILTFLLIERTVAADGVILLDEPELHLNPAVCKDLLAFLINSYAIRKNLQVIVCSHSPEILASALENDECSLFHLESEKLLTKVRSQDQSVIHDALRRLGASQIETLLYKGTIFVEGPDDIALLQAGFGDAFRRYMLKDLGGRSEIEKQIGLLLAAENNGESVPPIGFIFDRDEAPSDLVSSKNVRILQWNRRCFENYLIDIDVLADLLMDSGYVKYPTKSIGETQTLLKSMATGQLNGIAIRAVYKSRGYESPGYRHEDLKGNDLTVISKVLFGRLLRIKKQLIDLDEADWTKKFLADCELHKAKLEETWDAKWNTECDGKKLFADLHNKVQPIPGGLKKFKVRIMHEMRLKSSENWRSVKGMLDELLAVG